MPYIMDQGRSSGDMSVLQKDLGYSYFDGLDFRPKSELHKKVVGKIMERARESRAVISKRHELWDKIERNLTAYVPPTDEEAFVQNIDPKKPISLVVPVTFAVRDTIMTFLAGTFLQSPYFRYLGRGPEDVIGAILLEKVIEQQAYESKMGLNLYIFLQDSLTYGLGILGTDWVVDEIEKTVQVPKTFYSAALQQDLEVYGETVTASIRELLFEGNELFNIDPRMYLPDPNVPVHEVQKGEYVGWIQRNNRMALLGRESAQPDVWFNMKYLEAYGSGLKSSLFDNGDARLGAAAFETVETGSVSTTPIDIVHMHINLVPKEWGLGSGTYPEKWSFAVAGDRLIVKARPLGMNHNRFPVAVVAPDFDGYSATPLARLEMVYGLQHLVDFLVSSHVTNIRKSLNGITIYDPMLINGDDLKDPHPGKLVRTRRNQWGKGIQNAIMQLDVSDHTKGHLAETAGLISLIEKVSGASEGMMGTMRKGSERVSAAEASNVQSNAAGRLGKIAEITSLMGIQDIAKMLAYNTQQFISEERFVSVVGNWEQELLSEYEGAIQKGRVAVRPQDLQVSFDIASMDSLETRGDRPEAWVSLFQVIASQPWLAAQFDLLRIVRHIGRVTGARNVESFIKRAPTDQNQIQAQVLAQEEIDKSVSAGNLISMEDFQGGL